MELTASTSMVYLRRAFDLMLEVAERVGEERVNLRPLGDDTNSVAALIVHCCGVSEFWLGHVALGRSSLRAREDEFSTVASVTELRSLVQRTLAQAEADVAALERGEGTDEGGRIFLPGEDVSDASVVIHVLEELYQHLGHAELAADALR